MPTSTPQNGGPESELLDQADDGPTFTDEEIKAAARILYVVHQRRAKAEQDAGK